MCFPFLDIIYAVRGVPRWLQCNAAMQSLLHDILMPVKVFHAKTVISSVFISRGNDSYFISCLLSLFFDIKQLSILSERGWKNCTRASLLIDYVCTYFFRNRTIFYKFHAIYSWRKHLYRKGRSYTRNYQQRYHETIAQRPISILSAATRRFLNSIYPIFRKLIEIHVLDSNTKFIEIFSKIRILYDTNYRELNIPIYTLATVNIPEI